MKKYSQQIRLSEEDHAYLDAYKTEHQLSSFSEAVAHILLERRVQESLISLQLKEILNIQSITRAAAKSAADSAWLCLALLNDQMATATDPTHYKNDSLQLRAARQQLMTVLKEKQVRYYDKRKEE
ncbi:MULTISPECIES: hypothetical protein [Caproicibacterium]|uniref:Uncharacterized protein n=1 Tax=Caproicibacterium argilliputei TaxID=3030016 RepID=A0AA97D8P5_9FIRM|nr:hypothetical protein [Caproicibacterium argilliputei]WOC32359.1 hypothetical protein PXC00_00395 [Caproicibacterium argilliputei]